MKKKNALTYKQDQACFTVRALAAFLSAVIVFGTAMSPQVKAAESKDEMTYYEWKIVNNLTTTYHNPNQNTIIRTMLCWDNGGNKYYVSGHPSNFGDKNNWYSIVNMNNDRQVFDGEEKWLTDNGRGAPYFVVAHKKDGDNSNEPMVKILTGETNTTQNRQGQPSYKEVCTNYSVKFDDDDLGWTNSGKSIGDYNCTLKGKKWHGNGRVINIFHNESGRDPVLKIKSDHLSADYETDEDDRWKFWLYEGKEVKYARYPDGIWCNSGQVTALTVPSVLPEGTLTTVNAGSVLSVNANVFLNGKIVVDGGTLVLQEGSTLMTYSRDEAKAGTGCIEVKNGGSIVVMNNARMALGRTNYIDISQSETGQIKLTNGGKIYNFGFIMTGRLIMNDHASIENRKGGEIHLGYQLTDIGGLRFYYRDNYKNCLCTTTGSGGSLVSSAADQIKSMEGEDVLVVNKGTITLSSAFSLASGFTTVVEGNAPLSTSAQELVYTNNYRLEKSF